jgi:hypothetical protein
MNLLGVLDALKDAAAGVPNVKVAALGINQAWPSTPAVEVIASDVRLQTFAAGSLDQLMSGRVVLAVYVALTQNLEADERELVPIAEGLVDALNTGSFDRTLGGLVEDVRPIGIDFDLVKRNGRFYRTASVTVAIGDLEDNV